MSHGVRVPGLLLLAWLAVTGAAWGQTPPAVIHSPSNDGIPHMDDFTIGLDGSHTLHLWVMAGPNPTPAEAVAAGLQAICETGIGDEVCGVYAEVVTTGGVTITSFTPDSALVKGVKESPTLLKIVRANAAGSGDFPAGRLGTLVVNRTSGGDVVLKSTSRSVSARLTLVPLAEATIAVPEPSRWLMLVVALGFLALLHHLRTRRMAALLALLSGGLLASLPADAELYLNSSNSSATTFINAIGPDYEIENFSAYPFNGFSNGHDFGPFTWIHPSLASDIDLIDKDGSDSGLDGTLLVKGTGLPGGYGALGTPGDRDSILLVFDPPVQAAGIAIGDNRTEAGEYIRFWSPANDVLAQIPLPGSTSGSGSQSYIGWVSRPGEPLIGFIEVNEGWSIDDDITFDNVIWKETVEVTVDVDYTPRPRVDTWRQISTNELPDLDASDYLGARVTAIGDLNDDGTLDLAVSAQFGQGTGEVYVLFMNPDGTVRTFQRINETDGGFTGDLDALDDFGISLESLPDLDGDGIRELAVGARRDDDAAPSAGAIWILFLDSDGTVKSHQKITEGVGGFTGDLEQNDYFGFELAVVGDLDLDGLPDLAAGAPRDDDGASDQGAVYILFLNLDGTVKSHAKIGEGTAGFSSSIGVEGLAYDLNASDRFGSGLDWIPTPQASTSGVLVVGAPFLAAIHPISSANFGSGAVFFLALNPDGTVASQTGVLRSVSGLSTPAPGLFTPPAGESDALGHGLTALGDLDGDGFPDLAVGAYQADVSGLTDVGAVYVMFLDGFDPTAFADAVAATSGSTSGSTSALGPPNGSGSYLGNTGGGTLTVQFVNNAMTGNGSATADMVLHRSFFLPGPSQVNETNVWTIRLSADGSNFVTIPGWSNRVVNNCYPDSFVFCTSRDQIPIDIDSAGFGPGDEVRFVRIEQPEECTTALPTLGCLDQPKVDAVEAVNNLNFVYDADYDGLPDGYDNCRHFPNPDQEDADADGWGDFCDNCPTTFNDDQFDGDGDGLGDLCDDGELILRQLPGPSPDWQLRYRCPGDSGAGGLNAAIVIPPGATNVSFGGPPGSACDEPTANVLIPNPPTGYTPGTGCVGATELGVNIDPALSGVLGPGLTSPPGVRSDTLYLIMASQTGLCEANQEVVIGRLHYTAPPGGVAAVPQFTSRGLDTPGLGLTEVRFIVALIDPNVGIILLSLGPAPGETAGAETRWELCVEAQGEIHRLSLGFEAPPGTSASNLRWLHCNSVPDASLRRTCSSFPTQYSTRIATSCGGSACPSYTEGPDSADAVPTMFVVLEGLEPSSEPPITKLNTANASTCVGQVELVGSPGVPPDITVNGLETLVTQPAIMAAVDSAAPFGVPDAVATEDVSLASASGATSEDTDQDSVRDEDDNCAYKANTSQLNTGGLLSQVGNDNIGDVCQCGDLDLDGRMLLGGPDLGILMDVILGTNTTQAVLDRCSVAQGTECNVLDLVLLQRALAGKGPGLAQACEDAVPPVPQVP